MRLLLRRVFDHRDPPRHNNAKHHTTKRAAKYIENARPSKPRHVASVWGVGALFGFALDETSFSPWLCSLPMVMLQHLQTSVRNAASYQLRSPVRSWMWLRQHTHLVLRLHGRLRFILIFSFKLLFFSFFSLFLETLAVASPSPVSTIKRGKGAMNFLVGWQTTSSACAKRGMDSKPRRPLPNTCIAPCFSLELAHKEALHHSTRGVCAKETLRLLG